MFDVFIAVLAVWQIVEIGITVFCLHLLGRTSNFGRANWVTCWVALFALLLGFPCCAFFRYFCPHGLNYLAGTFWQQNVLFTLLQYLD